jgi:hypothetical protein
MFKTATRIALATITLALMGAAHADPQTVTVVGAAATPLRGLFPSEGAAIVGTYRLSDGRAMVLRQRGRAIVADLDGVPTTRLMAGAAGTLYAADDSMRLRFDNDAQTEEAAVTVSLRTGGANVVTLASARTTVR